MKCTERRYCNGIVRSFSLEMSLSFLGDGPSIQRSFYDSSMDEPSRKRLKGLIDCDVISIISISDDSDEDDANVSVEYRSSPVIITERGIAIKQEPVTNSTRREFNENLRTFDQTSTSPINLENDEDLPEILFESHAGNKSASDSVSDHRYCNERVPGHESVMNCLRNDRDENPTTLNQPNLEEDDDLPEIVFGLHPGKKSGGDNEHYDSFKYFPAHDSVINGLSIKCNENTRTFTQTSNSVMNLETDEDLPEIILPTNAPVKSESDSNLTDVHVKQEPIMNGYTIEPKDICVPVRKDTHSANATGAVPNKHSISAALKEYLYTFRHMAVKLPDCCKQPGICEVIHKKEGPAQQSSAHFTSLIKTMLSSEDKTLQQIALNHVCQKGVQEHEYMSLELIHLILGYMIGYKYDNETPIQQKSVPELRAVALASSILSNQLRKHPPCKPSMLGYYKKVVEVWWELLLRKIEDALKLVGDPQIDHEAFETPEDFKEESSLEQFTDALAHTARVKREKEEKKFLCLKRKERLQQLIIPLNFFVDLMERDVLFWLAKFWNPKASAFRFSIRPIIADLLWSVNEPDEGFPNQKCRDLLNLYQMMSSEPGYRRLCVRMIAVIAEVMRRKRPEKYPNIPKNCLEFARCVHFFLKSFCSCRGRKCGSLCSDVYVALSELYPHWLRFNVGALLLQVEPPANMYKVKECLIGESSLSSTKNMVYSITLAAGVEMLQLPSISHYHPNSNDCKPSLGASFDVDMVTEGALAFQKIGKIENLKCVTHFPKWV